MCAHWNYKLVDRWGPHESHHKLIIKWGPESWWPWVYRPGKTKIRIFQNGNTASARLEKRKNAFCGIYLNKGKFRITIAPSKTGRDQVEDIGHWINKSSTTPLEMLIDKLQGSLDSGLDVDEVIDLDKNGITIYVNMNMKGRYYITY